jgi:hypothetical protein
MRRPAARRPSTRALAAVTAFLLTAAIAALIVLYLQNRSSGTSLGGNLPSPTVFRSGTTTSGGIATAAPATTSAVRTATPAKTPRTPNPCPLNLPGFHCSP